jgi:prepilin-type N-terminal cleavage/methylation domain-containing protein
MKANQKGFSVIEILIVIVVMGLLGIVGWLVYDRQSNQTNKEQTANTQAQSDKTETTKQEETKLKALEKGTFGDKGEYGTLQAEGYTTTVKRGEAFCEENCQQYDYVFFNITKSENTKIFDYINSNAGNAFVQDKAIGMGCVANGVISYSNSSDTVSKEYTISQSDTQKILAATKDKPIRLDTERLQSTGGRGAPTCYSHFATFKVLE